MFPGTSPRGMEGGRTREAAALPASPLPLAVQGCFWGSGLRHVDICPHGMGLSTGHATPEEAAGGTGRVLGIPSATWCCPVRLLDLAQMREGRGRWGNTQWHPPLLPRGQVQSCGHTSGASTLCPQTRPSPQPPRLQLAFLSGNLPPLLRKDTEHFNLLSVDTHVKKDRNKAQQK